MGDLLALAGRVREELADVARVAERACVLARKAKMTGDDDYWDGVALNLHAFYTGVERILEAIAHEVDGSVPSGPHSHRDLLMQMAAELPGRRPAVVSRSCRDCLEEYRAFRHLVRNIYTFSLRPQRVAELVQTLPACLEALERDLGAFVALLEGETPPAPSGAPGSGPAGHVPEDGTRGREEGIRKQRQNR